MNKKLIAMAVAGALALPLSAQAADMNDVKTSGFVDVFYYATDEATPANESTFAVAEAEVDVETSSVRLDVDYKGAGGAVEQAYASADIGGWTLSAGQFNSMLTDDVQDAPDMAFSSNSLLFGYVPANLAGVKVSGMAGPANITVGYTNDASTPLVAGDAQNSILLVVGGDVMDGLNLEFGYLSQDNATGTAATDIGDILDINGLFTLGGLSVGLDYLTGSPDSGSGVFDSGYSLMAGYDLGNGFAVKARIENATFEGATPDTDVTTLYASYALSDNVSTALEITDTDDGSGSVGLTTLEVIGTF